MIREAWVRRVATLLALVGVSGAVYGACCKYKIEWSEESAPCTGSDTVYCEGASQSAASTDYGARNENGFRRAQCYYVQLSISGAFYQIGCDQAPPANAIFIGTMDDGTCCWATDVLEHPVVTSQEFMVSNCEGACAGGGGGA